jgi:hypothetical protein
VHGAQVFNRVIAPMSGRPGSETLAVHSEGILKQALKARHGPIRS